MVTAGMPVPAVATETAEMGTEPLAESAPTAQSTPKQENSGSNAVASSEAPASSVAPASSATSSEDKAQQQAKPAESSEPKATAAADAKEVKVTLSLVADGKDGKAIALLAPVETTAREGESAWDVTMRVLADKKVTYVPDEGTDYSDPSKKTYTLKSVTAQDGTVFANAADWSSYWKFLVNDSYSSSYPSGYVLKAGDRIEYRFGASNAAVNPSDLEVEDPQSKVEDLEAEWPTFANNGNVTDVPTPTSASVNWKTLVGYVTEPLIIDGKIYVATSSNTMGGGNTFDNQLKLLRIDEKSGQIEASTPLAGTLSYTARPVYSKGLIYIPLDGGRVQAVNVSTMKTRWVSAAPETGGQASTTLEVLEGIASETWYQEGEEWKSSETLYDVLFSGTTVFGENGPSSGSMLALDPLTGAVISGLTFSSNTGGFYWTNVVKVGKFAITGTTDGMLTTVTSGVRKTLDVGAAVNADLAMYNGQIVVPTRDGVLHVVSVAEDGTMTEVASKKILDGCKAGVTIVGDDAIVGGLALGGEGSAVVVVDLKTLAVRQTITKADGETLPGNSLYFISVPVLVSQQDGKSICYFTMNYGENENGTYTSGGNAYWFELGKDEAHLLLEPSGDAINVSDSPMIAGRDGALYYLNDSGNLIRLTQNIAAEDGRPTLSFDEQSAKPISRDHVVTITVSQTIPADATILDMSSGLESVFEATGDAPVVAIDGTKAGEADVSGQVVRARLGLQANGDMTLVAQAESSEGETEAKTKTATLTYQAKVRNDADLSSYEKNGEYVVPVTAQTSVNEDEARTYATSKSIKVAGSSSSGTDTANQEAASSGTPVTGTTTTGASTRGTTTSGTTTSGTTSTTRAATAKTADESFRVAWLVAPAVMVFAIALAMRLRNRED